MSHIDRLTAEQKIFVGHVGGAFVHACPGAGKTRTIMARLAKIAEELPPRRGMAILSFTNSAVDEFQERCRRAALDSLLKHPSFMGTLDSFVRHFLVLPACSTTCTTRPMVLDSWDRLGIEIRLSGQQAFRGDAVSLDLFDPRTNVIDPARIGQPALRNHVLQHRLKYQDAAARKRRGLLQAGYLSAGDARSQTLQLLRDPVKSVLLGRALAARFKEVMVDEGQDCNPLDLEVLSWLRGHGLHVTFVCDPDQAIYEFRDGSPAEIQAFKETYPDKSRLSLTGNFRSSPAICKLAATLRNAGQADDSVGETANVAHSVLLVGYSGRSPSPAIGRVFLDHIIDLGLEATNAIVLAHSGAVAQRACSGVALNKANGTSRIESLARMVAEFWSIGATARSREAAVQTTEGLLLDLMELRSTGEHPQRAILRNGVDQRAHRRRALRFLMSLPKACGSTDADRLAWIAAVHAQAELLALELPEGVTVRGFFRRPPNGKWSGHLQAPVELGLTCAKIHEAKGREYDSVCVVIPPNSAPSNRCEALFASWEGKIEAEAKRVIYVGVTRARRLTALAVPTVFADRCASLLEAGGVPFVRSNL